MTTVWENEMLKRSGEKCVFRNRSPCLFVRWGPSCYCFCFTAPISNFEISFSFSDCNFESQLRHFDFFSCFYDAIVTCRFSIISHVSRTLWALSNAQSFSSSTVPCQSSTLGLSWIPELGVVLGLFNSWLPHYLNWNVPTQQYVFAR